MIGFKWDFKYGSELWQNWFKTKDFQNECMIVQVKL